MSSLWQVDIHQPGTISPRVFDFFDQLELENQTSSASLRRDHPDTGPWTFRYILSSPLEIATLIAHLAVQGAVYEYPELAAITPDQISIDEIPEDDWLVRSYRGFPPFQVGDFFLRGTHDRHIAPPPGCLPILIDAVTAFGSGEHPTTRGCLLALQKLKTQGLTPSKILDMGTGSGILAIAALKLWDGLAVAVDNDPEAVRVAAQYRDLNEIKANRMTCLLGDTPRAAAVEHVGSFDLVIANILAEPLQALAPDLTGALAETGVLVLSGLLVRQADDICRTYARHSVQNIDQIILEDWATLILKR